MAFTKEGNQKMHARLKQQYGFDAEGKSIFHKNAGKKSRSNYFQQLKEQGETAKLKEISARGVAARSGKSGTTPPTEEALTPADEI